MLSTPLPIHAVIPDLKLALAKHAVVLLTAEPGAGKTTQVPLALLDESWLAGQRIIMLEPRRLAARNAATFMAHNLQEKVGETVGYRIRLEHKVSASTRIEVVTEGVLTRMLQADPELNGVGLIIFDEFHERNLHADLALALTHHCQHILRDDLRLLIMSATLDDTALSRALAAPVIASAGRSFPITTHYRPAANTNVRLSEQVRSVVHEALQVAGDVLVFLPGIGEIKQCQNALAGLPPQCVVLPLHGQLNDTEQKQVLTPAAAGTRKIILATNIAESSLTIDGVRIVIDSGLERRNEFQLSTGLSQLVTRSISQASSIQRAGRAGRQAAGLCYRLWPESQQARLDAYIRPEILDTDLAPLLVDLYQWGARPAELFWLTPPPAPALQQAQQLLQQLLLLNEDDTALNEHGLAVAALPLEPRLGHALRYLAALGHGQYACELVAVLQEFPHALRQTDDLNRLFQQAQRHSSWGQRVQPLAQKLHAQLRARPQIPTADTPPLSSDDVPALLLALAYPDRIAKQRAQNEQFLLANGRGAKLSQDSDLVMANWLACADISSSQPHSQVGTVRLAAVLTESLIEVLKQLCPNAFSQRSQIAWQPNGQLLALRIESLGQLELNRQTLPALTDEQWQQAWQDYMQRQGLNCLPWNDEVQQVRARLALAHQLQPNDWPAVSDEVLLQQLDAWLLPYLQQTRNLRDLGKVNLTQALLNRLTQPQQQRLKQLLPTSIEVPSGSNVSIDYAANPPVLAVKLQEMFGYEGKPAVFNGAVVLSLHLLSPARHPVAVTSDLPHFWRNSYAEVRKDLRGRYPRHPWPEDPLNATATRLTKAALARTQTP